MSRNESGSEQSLVSPEGEQPASTDADDVDESPSVDVPTRKTGPSLVVTGTQTEVDSPSVTANLDEQDLTSLTGGGRLDYPTAALVVDEVTDPTMGSNEEAKTATSKRKGLKLFLCIFFKTYFTIGIVPAIELLRPCRQVPEDKLEENEADEEQPKQTKDEPALRDMKTTKFDQFVVWLGVFSGLVGVVGTVLAILAELGVWPDPGPSRGLHIATVVEEGHCITGSIECERVGTAASAENENPVFLSVLVLDDSTGDPIVDLDIEDFKVEDSEGGALFNICEKPACVFRSDFGGGYDLFLENVLDGKWVAGSYTGTLIVGAPDGKVGRDLLSFKIPAETPTSPLVVESTSVDTKVCASAPIECQAATAGHTLEPAFSNNHNPIRLSVLITDGESGDLMTGLDVGNFQVSTGNTPSLEDAFDICTETVCGLGRFDFIQGLYHIFLDRAAEGTWTSGAYSGTIAVTSEDGRSGGALVEFSIQDAPDDPPSPLIVLEASIDTQACASGLVQCTVDSEHTLERADSDNHNPIRLTVLVWDSNDGSLLSNLLPENFMIETGNSPAGGRDIGICSQASCGPDTFQESNGLYTIFLDVAPAGAWVAGSYTAIVTVTSGDSTGRDVIEFIIPIAYRSPFNVEASVNTEICSTGTVQCRVEGTDHTSAAASSSNHNPVSLAVIVLDSDTGAGISGLQRENFWVGTEIVPAGGGSFGICSEAVCGSSSFRGGSNGFYRMFLDRLPAGNWTPGRYFGTVAVSRDGSNGIALIDFTIPSFEGL